MARRARWRATWRPPCRADADCSGYADPADVSFFVNRWFTSLQAGTLDGDFDQDGVVEPADISLFVGIWFAAVSSGAC